MGSTASGIQVFLEEGAWTKRFHPGWGAVAGITAAHLAKAGFTAPSRPFEGKFGLFDTHLQSHAKDVKINHVALNEVGHFDFPLNWHQPRIPGYGDINWAAFMGELMRIGYDGPLCIEVEDDTFGKTLEGRMKAIKVARNVLAPFFG